MDRINLPSEEQYQEAYRAFLRVVVGSLDLPADATAGISFNFERKFQLSFPSTTSNLELLRRLIMGFVANVALRSQEIEDIGLAVDEACTNIVQHSYTSDQEGSIDVSIEISANYIIISMMDTGQGGQFFDPSKMEPFEKQKYLERLERGGLGVYIIKTIMDEVDYNIQPGVYNRLRMVKYIRRPPTA